MVKNYTWTAKELLLEIFQFLPGSLLGGVQNMYRLMAYWMQHDLYRLADKGKSDSVVDSITAKINYHTHSYADRVAHFKKIKDIIA